MNNEYSINKSLDTKALKNKAAMDAVSIKKWIPSSDKEISVKTNYMQSHHILICNTVYTIKK